MDSECVEQITLLRERVARIEARLEVADKALERANGSREETKARVQSLVIGIITVAVAAGGTLIGLVIHLSRGG